MRPAAPTAPREVSHIVPALVNNNLLKPLVAVTCCILVPPPLCGLCISVDRISPTEPGFLLRYTFTNARTLAAALSIRGNQNRRVFFLRRAGAPAPKCFIHLGYQGVARVGLLQERSFFEELPSFFVVFQVAGHIHNLHIGTDALNSFRK